MKTITFVKQGNRWFPLIGSDTIDQRGRGFFSKKAVRRWAAEAGEFTGQRIAVSFR